MIDVAGQAIEGALRAHADDVSGAVVELSGGVDSANVALAAASMGHDLISYGIEVDRPSGGLQAARRAEVANKLGLTDSTVNGHDWLPLDPTGPRNPLVPHDPGGDLYCEAFTAARTAAGDLRGRLLLTGIGGDEISALRPDEGTANPEAVPPVMNWLGKSMHTAMGDENLAPIPMCPLPSLIVKAARNPYAIDAGLWPVSPLSHPQLVRLFDSLAPPWRRNKHLLRQRLRRANLSLETVYPRHPETFSEVMQAGLRRNGIPAARAMLRESLLIDEGLIDYTLFRKAVDIAEGAPAIPTLLYDTIACERGMRSLLTGGG